MPSAIFSSLSDRGAGFGQRVVKLAIHSERDGEITAIARAHGISVEFEYLEWSQ